MRSDEVRKVFLDFFREKGHKIVPSAPIVVKNDPTLLFTNAGMNQFKDYFLGNRQSEQPRVADTQKCLRVSGKHNDLEDVGLDTYHHTMFEMLGNWSFGDYFKKEALNWAFELLTERYKIDKERIYVTYFEGSKEEKVPADKETQEIWSALLPQDRILPFGKKENFWEMGDTGPCGPCSEIHVDLRSEEERKKTSAQLLVNKDHPQVIEIWNNVFIQYNRKADGSLEMLPAKHVDTGMGFERLCRVLQGKHSNYDTDVFQPLIKKLEKDFNLVYGENEKKDIACRVIADHIRAITFTIADGQLPSNTGAGYVIRRILRRAVRYGFTFLGMEEPYIHELVMILAQQFKTVFPEVIKQEDFIRNVIREEEASFLRTLASGTRQFEKYIANLQGKAIDGAFAFELYDTYGFPSDLTQLMAREKGLTVDMEAFTRELEKQKSRSRKAAERELGDWEIVSESDQPTRFIGYDDKETGIKILRYRKVTQKGETLYHAVFDRTPFYAEGGGEIGDTGKLLANLQEYSILNTFKENELIIHVLSEFPPDPKISFHAVVDLKRQEDISRNHSATHLLHASLRKVLGTHVQQKGSLVTDKYLRFDFSHFSKMTDHEIAQVEHIVNEKIREDIPRGEERELPFAEAQKRGAMALFGEKYGEKVRMITFDPGFSVELCGGIHVPATGKIGFFKIISESAVAAGVRRIEAVTGREAEAFINEQLSIINELKASLKNPKDLTGAVKQLAEKNKALEKELEQLKLEAGSRQSKEFIASLQKNGDLKENIFSTILQPEFAQTADMAKQIVNELRKEYPAKPLLIGAHIDDKAYLWLALPDPMAKSGQNAGQLIKEIAKEIEGGGGGQPVFASAVGKNPEGLKKALEKGKKLIEKMLSEGVSS